MKKAIRVLNIIFFAISIAFIVQAVFWFSYSIKASSSSQNMSLTLSICTIFYILSSAMGSFFSISSVILSFLNKKFYPKTSKLFSILSILFIVVFITLTVILYCRAN